MGLGLIWQNRSFDMDDVCINDHTNQSSLGESRWSVVSSETTVKQCRTKLICWEWCLTPGWEIEMVTILLLGGEVWPGTWGVWDLSGVVTSIDIILGGREEGRRRRKGSCLWGHGALEAMLRDMHTILFPFGAGSLLGCQCKHDTWHPFKTKSPVFKVDRPNTEKEHMWFIHVW